MTIPQVIELVAAVAIVAAGIWLYRRPRADGDQYGSQGAVILFVIGAVLAIHGLGLLEYHPSAAELGE
ncbi:MAG: hypothetical protein HOP96_06415 [Sphingomonas sp.]|nr:hypothetical protein [Sphingomonas sp.]